MCCADEGKNGKLGRAKWVKLSRRNERRNNKQGRPATVPKIKKKTFPVKERHTMFEGIVCSDNAVRKVRRPKPAIPDTGADD